MWITVFGNGSFSLGPYSPIWRGPASYEITDEQAEQCLAYKDKHSDSNLFVISATEPADEPEPTTERPDWMFHAPRDAAWNEPEPEPDEPDISPGTDYEPDPDEYPCDRCEAMFTSAARLTRHVEMHHASLAADMEQEAREQLAAEKERKAAQERVRQADPKELHPAERPLDGDDLPDSPLPDYLWPPGLRGPE